MESCSFLEFGQREFPLIDSDELRNVLEDGLKQTFEQVCVEWVQCPDLTREPFNLAAPGLCGQTALLKLGDSSYLKQNPKPKNIYDINKILNSVHHDCSNSFIFGSGISAHPNGTLGELVINASIPRDEKMGLNNKSCIISVDTSENKCNVQMLTDLQLECNIYGTFFISQGSIGPVLRVHVKKYRETIRPSVTGFIYTMQYILKKTFDPISKLVVLGGVFVSSNFFWTHHLTQHSWEPQMNSVNSKVPRFCTINSPEAVITTFNSSTIVDTEYSPQFSSIDSMTRFIRCLSHHNAGEQQFLEYREETVEYLGYFCPAQKAYTV